MNEKGKKGEFDNKIMNDERKNKKRKQKQNCKKKKKIEERKQKKIELENKRRLIGCLGFMAYQLLSVI